MVLAWLLYFVLLAGALVFCWQTLQEFSLGSKGYSISQNEPMALSDPPTLTICLELRRDFDREYLVYGQDLFIQLKLTIDETVETTTLQEDKDVPSVFGLQIHLMSLQPLWSPNVFREESSKKCHCYKISAKWNG